MSKEDEEYLDVVDPDYINDDMYEPEVWGEKAIRNYKDNDYNEDEWVATEFERDKYDDNEIYAYEEAAYEEELERYMEFEKACEEESSLSQEEIDMMKIARRPFKEFFDLDIESYWNSKNNMQNKLSDEDIINTMDVSGLLPVT